jgi:fucose permease
MLRLAVMPVAITLAFLVFSAIVIEHGFINLLPTFNNQVMGLLPKLGIQLAALYAIFSIIGRMSVGFLLRRISWFPIMVACIVATIIVLIAGLMAARGPMPINDGKWSHAPLATLLLCLTGLFVGPIWPVIHSAALTTLPVSRHNTLASLSVVFSSISGAIGTPLLGMMFFRYGGVAAFTTLLIPLLILIGGIISLRQIKQGILEPATTWPTRG